MVQGMVAILVDTAAVCLAVTGEDMAATLDMVDTLDMEDTLDMVDTAADIPEDMAGIQDTTMGTECIRIIIPMVMADSIETRSNIISAH